MSDVMSAGFREKQHMRLHEAKQYITVVNKKETLLLGKVSSVLIVVGPSTMESSYLIACTISYDLIDGRLYIKVQILPDIKKDVGNFAY